MDPSPGSGSVCCSGGCGRLGWEGWRGLEGAWVEFLGDWEERGWEGVVWLILFKLGCVQVSTWVSFSLGRFFFTFVLSGRSQSMGLGVS